MFVIRGSKQTLLCHEGKKEGKKEGRKAKGIEQTSQKVAKIIDAQIVGNVGRVSRVH